MALEPMIKEEDIRLRAEEVEFERGEELVDEGAVTELVRRGSYVHGRVEGDRAVPYHVDIKLREEGGVEWTRCTSHPPPSGVSAYVVAVMLTMSRFPEDVEVRPSIEEQLAALTSRALRELWLEMVEQKVETIEWIEAHIPLVVREGEVEEEEPEPTPIVVAAPAKEATTAPVVVEEPPKQAPKISLEDLRWQVRTLVHGLDLLHAEEAARRVNEVVEELKQLFDRTCRLQAGVSPKQALSLMEAFLDEWGKEWEHLAVKGPGAEALWLHFDEPLAECLLASELGESESDQWYGMLSDWQDELEEDELTAFPLSLLALEEGWDEPVLQQKLKGEWTRPESAGADDDEELWEDSEDDETARKLVMIRLQVLFSQKKFEQYANYARANGAVAEWLSFLASTGKTEEALTLAQMNVSKPQDAIHIAQTLAEGGKHEAALSLVDLSLSLDGMFYEEGLAWGRDLAVSQNDPMAFRIGFEMFRMFPSLSAYKAMESIAGAEWPEVREKLQKQLTEDRQTTKQQVEIHLYEGRVDEAIQIAEAIQDETLLNQVVDAVWEQRPSWAIQICKKQSEPIIEHGLTEQYPKAIKLLRKASRAASEQGSLNDFCKYLQELLTTHSRKRKLTPMLRELLDSTRSLLKLSRRKKRMKRAQTKSTNTKKETPTTSLTVHNDRYEEFVLGLSEPAQQFLTLLEQQGNLIMSEVEEALALESKRAVGGIVGSIKRRANKYQLQPPYETEMTEAGERFWRWIGKAA